MRIVLLVLCLAAGSAHACINDSRIERDEDVYRGRYPVAVSALPSTAAGGVTVSHATLLAIGTVLGGALLIVGVLMLRTPTKRRRARLRPPTHPRHMTSGRVVAAARAADTITVEIVPYATTARRHAG